MISCFCNLSGSADFLIKINKKALCISKRVKMMLCTLNILKMVVVGIRTFNRSCLVNYFWEQLCILCHKICCYYKLEFYLLPQQEVTFNGTLQRDILASVIYRLAICCEEEEDGCMNKEFLFCDNETRHTAFQ